MVVASCNGEQFQPALNEIYVNRKNLTKTAEFVIKFQNDTVKHKDGWCYDFNTKWLNWPLFINWWA